MGCFWFCPMYFAQQTWTDRYKRGGERGWCQSCRCWMAPASILVLGLGVLGMETFQYGFGKAQGGDLSVTEIKHNQGNVPSAPKYPHLQATRSREGATSRLGVLLILLSQPLGFFPRTYPALFLFTDPVCRPKAGIQQAPDEDRPPLAVPLHLAVVDRQLQLRWVPPPTSITGGARSSPTTPSSPL